uniref:Uncharacterized protein n=1 Tax=Graphocephala atropunctata TaxID=36148 RepID=A0A1B6LLR1_9HEMI
MRGQRQYKMCVRGWLSLCVSAALITITAVAGAPDSSTWIRPQPQQTLHGLMVSIDERLHTLENTRWEATLKQVEQRLDSLESTIRRLDSAFQDRLDKFERKLNSKELKDELMVEKLSHKVRDILDLSYDRYNRRLGYTEERLEMSFKKVQMSVEGSLNRIEKQQEDIQTEMVETFTLLEDLKSQSSNTEDKLNSTHKAIQQHIQTLIVPHNEQLQRISGSLEHLGSRLNNTNLVAWGSQNDGPQVNDIITTIRSEINLEGNKFTNKVNNMYNDMWRRVMSLESLVKDLSRSSNSTQREMLDQVRSLILTDRRDFAADSQENFIEVALDALERKLQRKLLDLGRKVDDRLDTLGATQNLLMDSCFDSSLCRGLESRLSQVLEKIFDVFSDRIESFYNRTFDMDDLVVEMMELVKNQHSQLIRTVTHNTNMVVTLTKNSSDANRLLQNSLTQLSEKTDYNFQELQDEVQDIYNTSGRVCSEGGKANKEANDDLQQPATAERNITEVKVITLDKTQSLDDKQPIKHDEGILKITADDIETLADNSSLAYLPPIGLKLNTTMMVDTSIMQVIGMMSPNLTQNQLETFLQYLNSTVSLHGLEAIIQNTEADSEDETGLLESTSDELYDSDPFNKTNLHSDVYLMDDKLTNVTTLSENVGEVYISGENNAEVDQDFTSNTEIDQYPREIVGKAVEKESINQTEVLGISPVLREQVKVYGLLMKIKYGHLNITGLWMDISQNQGNGKKTEQLCVLQKLCYGEETTKNVKPEYVNNVMRNRLIFINQTINDINLYEKIEDICNMMTESLQTKSNGKHFLSND